jgi:phosphatidate cytidylyltransferase
VPALASVKPAAWADLRLRALSAAVLAPLALLCIWLGATLWIVLLAVGAVGLTWEWAALCGRHPLAWPGALAPLAVLAAGAVAFADHEDWALLLLAGSTLAAWAASGRRSFALGIPYVGVAGVALVWLRGDGAAGRASVLFLVLLVWASDVGAYAAGRLIGGPRLAPRVSPSKTWAGALGGLLAAALVGAVAAALLGAASPGRAALVAGLLGIASQAGDLLESWVKRRFGVKDSGRLIPGHGGLLDRLDGLLAAAPAAALLSLILGQGRLLWS